MSDELQGTPKRILIIDDDVDFLMLLERSLLRNFYEVETAASLTEAEDLVSFFEPDLILLDININGDDGRQLCWKLKHHAFNKFIKVILMSGYDLSIGRAFLFGADDLLAKPLHTEFLLRKVETHLALSA